MELAPTPRRSPVLERPVGAADVVALPRPLSVSPAPLLATLGLLVVMNIPVLGDGGWVFRTGKIEPHGLFAPLVAFSDRHWNPALLRGTAVLAGMLLILSACQAWKRWTARRATAVTVVIAALLLVPAVALQAGLRDSSAPWFFTNDSTYQIEVAGDLVLDGQSPYGHDYLGSGIERFYSRDGEPRPRHEALHHFPYFPGAAESAAAWRVLPAPLDDYRILVVLATLALIPASLLFSGPVTVRLALGAALAANPIAVKAAWFGTADAPSILCLVLAFGLASRSRFAWAAASLGAAILLKQFALVALPFFAVMVLTSPGGRESFGRAGKAFAGVVAAGLLPFLIASPGGFWEDTVRFGTGDYRIVGYGLPAMLLRLNVLDNRSSAYPFALLAILVWLPVTAWLVRNQLKSRLPWAAGVGFAASMFLLLFLGRVFQYSYLLWPLAGMAIAGMLAAAQTARGTSTTKVDPRPGSDLTEIRPFMRSTNSLLM